MSQRLEKETGLTGDQGKSWDSAYNGIVKIRREENWTPSSCYHSDLETCAKTRIESCT